MKKILLLLVALLCLSSCNWILPIHSLSEIEPGLRKYVGEPSRIDTAYKNVKDEFTYNSIRFQYNVSSNVSFERAVHFFSEAFICEPELKLLDGVRRRADFKSEPGMKPFSIMLYERIDSLGHVGGLMILALDKNNELPTPPSQTSSSDTPTN